MIFKIGGGAGTDIVPMAATGGISWKRVNIEGGNGAVMADGTMFKDRLASRYEWTFAFRPMTAAEQAALLELLNVRYVTVLHTDPETNEDVASIYYVSDVPAGYLIKRTDGTDYWGGMTATFTGRSPRA